PSAPSCSVSDTAPTGCRTPSLHDALPIYVLVAHRGEAHVEGRVVRQPQAAQVDPVVVGVGLVGVPRAVLAGRRLRGLLGDPQTPDRKSTRLNSSHVKISYAVFCLKKKTTN